MALHVRTPLLIVIALALVAVLLACGPAATRDANESAGIQLPPVAPPQEAPPQDEPTEEPILPTKPTYIPTNTPRPTLPPNPPESATEQARHDAMQAAAGQSEPSLASQVTDFTRDGIGGQYEAIVRAEVTAHRLVEPDLTIDWPDRTGNPPYFPRLDNEDDYAPWRRSKLNIIETYHGNLPQGYELIAPDFGINQALDVGQEYIIYVARAYVAENDFPDRPGLQHYNEEQLTAIGGPGGYAALGQTWIIDGDTAWRLSRKHVLRVKEEPSLTAGKASGDGLPVTELVAAIKAGLGN